MRRQLSVNLGNLLLSLSDAMDLASPQLAQHQQRTAFTVWQMGKVAGVSEEIMEDAFIAALLHDIGALSVEEKVALRQSFVEEVEIEDTDTHCIRGYILLKKVPWLAPPAQIVRFHHREWSEWDEPIEAPHVLKSQLLFLADRLERLVVRDKYILHQDEDLISKIKRMSGTDVHPDVVEYFVAVANREEFWLDLVSPRLYSLLLHEGPYRKFEVDIFSIHSLSQLFGNIIDFRSRFTATHSAGVAACATMLAKIFGLTDMEVQLMEIAGNLHDLGKLGIPNSILEKRGKLSKEEFSVIRSHTYHTYSLLNTIGNLEQIAEWAAFHHERLDGSGYPFHLTADELGTGARIMAVADIFTALAEDRPYRKGMSQNEIRRIIKQFGDREVLDPRIISLLFDNYDQVASNVKEAQISAMGFYEQQVAFPEDAS